MLMLLVAVECCIYRLAPEELGLQLSILFGGFLAALVGYVLFKLGSILLALANPTRQRCEPPSIELPPAD